MTQYGETITTYTTQEEMERLFGSTAIDLRTDDEADPSQAITDAIYDATLQINTYCQGRYDPTYMAQSQWVRRNATYLACYFLSKRRGNPEQYEGDYDRIMSQLQAVANGQIIIPNLQVRSDFTPSMSNLRVDDRFSVNKIRVESTISTGGSSGRQDVEPQLPNNGI